MYVIDDNETEESRYLLAQVPLLPLAQGRTSVSDTYTLTQVEFACLFVDLHDRTQYPLSVLYTTYISQYACPPYDPGLGQLHRLI